MKWLAANVGSMAMALLLAGLTWGYLWSQSTSTSDVEVVFSPKVALTDLARIEYETDTGVPLRPGESFRVRIKGPRAEIPGIGRSRQTYVPTYEARRFEQESGTIVQEVRREDFSLPDSIRIENAPRSVTLRYVRLVEREVPVVVPKDAVEGSPAVGYKVARILPRPERIRVLVPADRDLSSGVPIRKIRIAGQKEIFTVDGQLDLKPPSRAIGELKLDIHIEPDFQSKTLSGLPLYLWGPPEVVRRLDLESPTLIDIKVTGPAQILDTLVPADFEAYVVITLAPGALTPGATFNQGPIRCHLGKEISGEVRIEVMPGVAIENREAKVKVRPE